MSRDSEGGDHLSDEDPLHSPGLHGKLRFLPLNFRLGLQERMRAAAGLPAWIRRTRNLEQALEELECTLEVACRRSSPGAWERTAASWDLSVVNTAIEAYNDNFPIERDLPMDPRSRDFSHQGRPWKPLPALDSAWILERFPVEGAGCSST